MAKTKLEKITSIEEEIKQLINQKNELLRQQKEEERKARNHRLCKRGGLVEKLLPDIITLSDVQFEKFVERTLLTPNTARIIAELMGQNVGIDAREAKSNNSEETS